MITAVVPVKNLWQAKQRLANMLSKEERHQLCMVMLLDVLAALKDSRLLDDILVYSPDPDVLRIASQHGIGSACDGSSNSQSEAVLDCLPICAARGAHTILTIPVDVPLLRGEDIDVLIEFSRKAALSSPSAIMVPSADGTGTNALLLTPPDALTPRFGLRSFARHLDEASQLGVSHRHVALPRLALDIDCPADLVDFLCASQEPDHPATKTYQHLVDNGLAERCLARVPD